MGTEIQQEWSWLGSWWKAPVRKGPVVDFVKSTTVVGPLTHEVASLMSKLINLWSGLTDAEMRRLREVVFNSAGIRKLVSDDDDVLVELVLNEMLENWGYAAKYVSRLGRKCADPVVCRFEEFLNDPDENELACYEWEYKFKKMDEKVRKMERLVGFSMQLNQELEVLTEMEQMSRRMHVNGVKKVKLLEHQQKVMWQSQMVKDVRDKSLWNRTYDYTVRLMARSLFTIVNRLKDNFGVLQKQSLEKHALSSGVILPRSQSFSATIHSAVYPSENDVNGLHSEIIPVERSILISVPENKEMSKRMGKAHHRSSSSFSGKSAVLRSKSLVPAGPFKGCMVTDCSSPSPMTCKPTLGGSMRMNSFRSKKIDKMVVLNKHSPTCQTKIHSKIRLYNSKRRLSNHPRNTLGDVGLALHYANVIILIEKLATAPHLIGQDARDDLYKKLPTAIKSALRCKLKPCARTLASTGLNADLAAEWSSAVAQILEWLAPLAHDTIRRQSERNFEKQQTSSKTNALLVQTFHYANQMKTEAAIIELLLGLNYLCRFGTQFQVETKKKLIPDEYMLQTEIIVL